MNHSAFVELWKSGVCASHIAEKLQISENYVYKYARAHREDCPTRYKFSKKDSTKNIVEDIPVESVSIDSRELPESVSLNDQNPKEVMPIDTSISFDTVVIDTSSLNDLKTFELIERANHVIISSVVLREINKLKDIITDLKLKQNFQKLLKACALDINSQKYLVTNAVRQNNECNDETIVRNAANITDAVIITKDYGLCCFCKLYNVKYILLSEEMEAFVQSVVDNVSIHKEDNNTVCKPDDNALCDNDSRIFCLERELDTLFITCLKGTIEVEHEGNVKILLVSDKAELVEGDYLTIHVKNTQHFVVKRNKKKVLILMPIKQK